MLAINWNKASFRNIILSLGGAMIKVTLWIYYQSGT